MLAPTNSKLFASRYFHGRHQKHFSIGRGKEEKEINERARARTSLINTRSPWRPVSPSPCRLRMRRLFNLHVSSCIIQRANTWTWNDPFWLSANLFVYLRFFWWFHPTKTLKKENDTHTHKKKMATRKRIYLGLFLSSCKYKLLGAVLAVTRRRREIEQ